MNGKQQAIDKIVDFLKSDRKGLFLAGTHRNMKHCLIMALLNVHCKGSRVLFRMARLKDAVSTPILLKTDNDAVVFQKPTKIPSAGEIIKNGYNHYSFDAYRSITTWDKTYGKKYDFALVYPVEGLCKKNDVTPIQELLSNRSIGKLFLCTWHDGNYQALSEFYTDRVVYDIEEEDANVHKHILEWHGGHGDGEN